LGVHMYSYQRVQTTNRNNHRATVTSILCNLTDEQRRQFTTRTNQTAQKQQRLASLAHQPQLLWPESDIELGSASTSYWQRFVTYIRKIWH